MQFPSDLSVNAQNILRGLLDKDPLRRLGGRVDDADEIMTHPFFSTINWEDLYHKKVRKNGVVLELWSWTLLGPWFAPVACVSICACWTRSVRTLVFVVMAGVIQFLLLVIFCCDCYVVVTTIVPLLLFTLLSVKCPKCLLCFYVLYVFNFAPTDSSAI